MSWMPSIEVETAQGIREISLSTYHLMKGRIFLSGEITHETSQYFLEQILYLEEEGKSAQVIIDSQGGNVDAGMSIYDVLQSAKIPVDLYCDGYAMSMAAIILSGGQKGHRFILPHSRVMIHEPLIRNEIGGSASSIRNLSETLLEARNMTNGILAKHTGKTLEEINKATECDYYMDADQAVEFGIVDRVVSRIG